MKSDDEEYKLYEKIYLAEADHAVVTEHHL